MKFAVEAIKDVWDEAEDLVKSNHGETGSLPDEDFKPDRDKYFKIDGAGMIKVFTARDEGRLVGYAIFLIAPHLHYSDKLWAQQDVMFIDKFHRGMGAYRFMTYVDEELERIGVGVILRSVHARNDYSRILEKIGYQKIETSFMRRIN